MLILTSGYVRIYLFPLSEMPPVYIYFKVISNRLPETIVFIVYVCMYACIEYIND